MAKKTARGRPTAHDPGGRLADFAEDLGRLLGTTERKASAWLGQRKVLAAQLTAVRDQADKLLHQLTGGAADVAAAVGLARGTRKSKVVATGKKRGRKRMSAAEKKAVSARMKKYWAARRAKSGKKSRKATAKDEGHAVGNG